MLWQDKLAREMKCYLSESRWDVLTVIRLVVLKIWRRGRSQGFPSHCLVRHNIAGQEGKDDLGCRSSASCRVPSHNRRVPAKRTTETVCEAPFAESQVYILHYC